MASGEGEQWDAQKMLDLYIHDYMVKKNMYETSEIFAKEANVCHSVVIDSPEGFLTEWWMMFWDIYSSRLSKHPEAKEESSNKTKQMMPNEIQNFCPILPKPDVHQQRTGQDFGKMMGQPAAGLLAAKIYEEEHLKHPTRDLNPNIQLLDVDKLAHSKPSSSNTSHTQQQISKKAQQWVVRDNTRGISLGKSLPMGSALYGVPKGVFPRTGLHDAGLFVF
ncbi:hypothetical protein F0562_014130 [Nyssa sinensis]|uniref:Uncharacterized protein n=1 Tax=Nyssa sinensis TaxID=561372 RepID=A0A5J4ZM97_9ASTE|nr:hypothetical protein F0562_014130 [Nyssa sinensis]